jgi:hypothetical protein
MAVTPILSSAIRPSDLNTDAGIPASAIRPSDLNVGATRDIGQNSAFGEMVSGSIQGLRQTGHAYEMESAKSMKGAGNEIDLAIVSANLETSLKTVRETLSAATATFKEIYHIQAG